MAGQLDRDRHAEVAERGSISVGVDVGGTFTDVVWVGSDRQIRLLKVPTTRSAPGEAVRAAVAELSRYQGVAPQAVGRFAHGTTVATNAVLERKGAKVGLLTTHGFRDALEIGRSFRTDMYDLFVKTSTPAFLAPGSRRRGVRERIGPQGDVLLPIDAADLQAAIDGLLAEGVEAIAVSFLFSFLNPVHELAARDAIHASAPGLPVSLSHEVDPAFREYERSAVTAFDAYVKPVLNRYLEELEADLRLAGMTAPLQVIQSRGGLTSAGVARQRPVRLFLSGPAAGAIGGQAAGAVVDEPDLITFDVGGTSCDIALIQRGTPLIRSTGLIDGFTVRVPMVDVNAIGAGGGSIAWLDAAGGLRVGPHSAGSEPGPACYGRGGTEATITDASVMLGYLDPEYFAGGLLKLQPLLAEQAVRERIATPLGLEPAAAAVGMHRVLNAQMAEGIRLVSIQRGIDPRQFTLVPLGGGGGIHAIPLARELGIRRILVPRHPGVLAACGLLGAPVEHEVAAAFPAPLDGLDVGQLEQRLEALDAACAALMEQEGLASDGFTIRHAADLCYVGQSHALEVELDRPLAIGGESGIQALYADFLETHDRVYGHAPRVPARFVNLRAVATAAAPAAIASRDYEPRPGPARKGTRKVVFDVPGTSLDAAIYDREALALGENVRGPAVLEQRDTTTLVEPGWQAEVAAGGSLIMRPTP